MEKKTASGIMRDAGSQKSFRATPSRVEEGAAKSKSRSEPRASIAATTLDTVRLEPIEYLDQPFFPLGIITIVAGEGGVGKSTFVIDRIAKATRGELNGKYRTKPVHVAMLSEEDDPSIISARVRAAGGRTEYVHLIDGLNPDSGRTTSEPARLEIPSDLRALECWLGGFTDEERPVLLVIDPITSYLNVDANKRDDVRKSLEPLASMARRMHIAVVCIMHFNKAATGSASNKISGSHAFRDLARSVITMAVDKPTGTHYVTLDKMQYGSSQGSSWSYAIETVTVPAHDGSPISVGRVGTLTETQENVDAILTRNAYGTGTDMGVRARMTRENMAARFILDYLCDHDGNAPKDEVIQAAKDAGFSPAAINNARTRKLGNTIHSVKEFGGKALWKLQENDAEHDGEPA